MIRGIDTTLNITIKIKELIKNKYLTILSFNEKLLNFNENKGKSTCINILNTIVMTISVYLFNIKDFKFCTVV